MRPADDIVARSSQKLEAKDSLGRSLVIRRINALDRLRLLKAAGPELARNDAWLNMAALAVAVTELNGIPRTTPVNERQIEAAISELGDEGLEAVAEIPCRIPRSLTIRRSTRGKLRGHTDLIECLYLVKNGVPFDVAFSLSERDRLHFCFVLRELS